MTTWEIYTDGSHFKAPGGSGRLGIGGVIVKDGKIIDEFSQEIKPEYLKFYYSTTDCSNPTMEMLAVLWALWKFGKHIGPGDKVIFKEDYQGVKEWNTGHWKINKPYIAKIHSDIHDELYKQNLIGRVEFTWVKAHQKNIDQDSRINNYVDLLAKGEKQ